MNIKIDINLNLENINQIIETLTTMMNFDTYKANICTGNNNSAKETITIDTIRENISKLSQNGKIQTAKEILSKYNASKVSQINCNDYENINKELITMLNTKYN